MCELKIYNLSVIIFAAIVITYIYIICSISLLQMWSVFLHATDKVVSKIQSSVQQMKSLLTTELQPLIKNKRGAGVAFNKDNAKSENEYSASSTEVYTLQQAYKEHTKNANKYKKKVKKSKTDR